MASAGRGHSQRHRGGRQATVPTMSISRRPQKTQGWTGVRECCWGGWATEIRIPRTRFRLWIGRFQHALEAALAYDATMFCFYGEHLPRKRRFNLPAIGRPIIPDHVRIHLTIATIRAIAADHGPRCVAFLAPLMSCVVPAALSAPPPMAWEQQGRGWTLQGHYRASSLKKTQMICAGHGARALLCFAPRT